jgi:hypothetical protein
MSSSSWLLNGIVTGLIGIECNGYFNGTTNDCNTYFIGISVVINGILVKSGSSSTLGDSTGGVLSNSNVPILNFVKLGDNKIPTESAIIVVSPAIIAVAFLPMKPENSLKLLLPKYTLLITKNTASSGVRMEAIKTMPSTFLPFSRPNHQLYHSGFCDPSSSFFASLALRKLPSAFRQVSKSDFALA